MEDKSEDSDVNNEENDIKFEDDDAREADQDLEDTVDLSDTIDKGDLAVIEDTDMDKEADAVFSDSNGIEPESDLNNISDGAIENDLTKPDTELSADLTSENPQDTQDNADESDDGDNSPITDKSPSTFGGGSELLHNTFQIGKMTGNMFSDPLGGLKHDAQRIVTNKVLNVIKDKIASSAATTGAGTLMSGAGKLVSTLARLTTPGPLLAVKIGLELGVILGTGLGSYIDELLDDIEDGGFITSISAANIPDLETFSKELHYVTSELWDDMKADDMQETESDLPNIEAVLDSLRDACDCAMDSESYEKQLDSDISASFEADFGDAEQENPNMSDIQDSATDDEPDEAAERDDIEFSYEKGEIGIKFEDTAELASGIDTLDAQAFMGDDVYYSTIAFSSDITPLWEVDDYSEDADGYNDASEGMVAYNRLDDYTVNLADDTFVLQLGDMGDTSIQDDLNNEMQRQLADQEMRNEIERQEIEREMTRFNTDTDNDSYVSSDR